MSERKNDMYRNGKNHSLRKYRSSSASTGKFDKVMAFFHNNKKFGIVILVVVVLIVLVMVLSMCGNDDMVSETTGADETMTNETEEIVETMPSYELHKDNDGQISELVNRYFTAMKENDVETYNNIVAGEAMTLEKLENKGSFIEDYREITCYTKPGMTDGSYVVYVYYEIKFHNIDTCAPAMSLLYICSNDDGSMYIYAGEWNAELVGYINTVSNDEELRILEQQCNQKLEDNCAADEKLAALVKLLMDPVVPEPETETSPEPETDISEMVFEERDEIVITTTGVRVRSTPTTETDENILGTVAVGEELKRIGYNVGWSKVIYNGKEAYISSSYVITK